MVVPGDVDVASSTFVAPDVATFAIEHRCSSLTVFIDVVPKGTFVGLAAVFVEFLFPSCARKITVPGVKIGEDMVEVAWGVVLDETSGVECLSEEIHIFDPILSCPMISTEAIGFTRAEESPGLVEIDPSEDGGMVVVATYLTTHATFPVLTTEGIIIGPPVGRILHNEKA
jgi:hypothetical protein